MSKCLQLYIIMSVLLLLVCGFTYVDVEMQVTICSTVYWESYLAAEFVVEYQHNYSSSL